MQKSLRLVAFRWLVSPTWFSVKHLSDHSAEVVFLGDLFGSFSVLPGVMPSPSTDFFDNLPAVDEGFDWLQT